MIAGGELGFGSSKTFTENAVSDWVTSRVEFPSSAAERMMDCIIIGLSASQ